ncbi:MAG: cobalamin biosynthesis protein P47K [Planctomycetota bacterium]|nr:cobalamin biosynthesis protein P47K [Planctomycetota bacterium]
MASAFYDPQESHLIMPDNPRFIMIGGFLGAGKTTTISRLAQHYQSQGKRVAIVTNDQATDLVDTNLLRSQGFDVGEVAGSCFCCNFNELTRTVERLGENSRPDIVIAEPVGSCTDLVATVIRPLQQIYAVPFEIAPYGVILKPSHGLKILRGTTKGGFSPQAEYIFRKQIEEADFVILNRIDELNDATISELTSLIQLNFPGLPCVKISAMTGLGFEAFYDYLDLKGNFGTRALEVDYDIYAAGEAELGWLNAQVALKATNPFALDAFLLKLLERINEGLTVHSAEVAHLKAIGMAEGKYAVANIVSSLSAPKLSIGCNSEVSVADLVINARVAVDPNLLTESIQAELHSVCIEFGIKESINTLQCFRPGRPVPTHRLAGVE